MSLEIWSFLVDVSSLIVVSHNQRNLCEYYKRFLICFQAFSFINFCLPNDLSTNQILHPASKYTFVVCTAFETA